MLEASIAAPDQANGHEESIEMAKPGSISTPAAGASPSPEPADQSTVGIKTRASSAELPPYQGSDAQPSNPHPSVCLQCGERFDSSSLRQIYCSRACNIAHYNASRSKTQAKTTAKSSNESFRSAADGLFCRTCGKPIDCREGWRLDHRTCARERILAAHPGASLADDEDNL